MLKRYEGIDKLDETDKPYECERCGATATHMVYFGEKEITYCRDCIEDFKDLVIGTPVIEARRNLKADLDLIPSMNIGDISKSAWTEAINRALTAETRVAELQAELLQAKARLTVLEARPA